MQTIDMTGKKYGKWTVLRRDGSTKTGVAKWFCRCECGRERVINGDALRRGGTKSCGCIRFEIRKLNNSPAWKGGRYIDKEGYVNVRTNKGNELEHRLVMSQTLHRELLTNEVVHHKNGIRTDNRPENLQLFGSQREHISGHKLKLEVV